MSLKARKRLVEAGTCIWALFGVIFALHGTWGYVGLCLLGVLIGLWTLGRLEK